MVLVCMSSCNVVGWWMSSWCITASPPHGKVYRVLNGRCFAWCFFCMLPFACMLECFTGSSLCERCMFIHSSIHEHILHVASSIHPQRHPRMIIHSQAYLFTCVVCSSVGQLVLLHMLPFIHPIRLCAMFIFVCVPILTHDEITSNQETSQSTMIHDHFGCRWLGEERRLRGGMEALGTTNENCARVTHWWRWAIQIDSEYPQDFAQMEEKPTQFFRGTIEATGRLGRHNLYSFHNEWVTGLGQKFAKFFGGTG